MGKRNRERRRVDQRQRRSRGSRPGAGDGRVAIETSLLAAARALRQGDGAGAARHLAILGVGEACAREGPPAPLVGQVLERLLDQTIEKAWRYGWQPADVARVVRRLKGPGPAAAAAGAIASQHRRYSAATVDPAWRDQLRAIGADPWAPTVAEPDGRMHLDDDRRPVAPDHRASVEVLSVLLGLPRLPRLGPQPGEARCSAATAGAIDTRVLERVRALLAKAESTTFAEEAEAFTAKAQELMARHSVDRAMVDGARPPDGPQGRRIGVDDPYAQAKSLLLGEVAVANRCRAVWTPDLGFSTVLGHQPDLDGVELLYTSLLVQAVAGMAAAGSQVNCSGRSHTRSFRTSFLVAYAHRIGQRLREATHTAEAAGAVEHGAGLMPVLASRDHAVDAAVEATFPETRRHSVSVTNGAGWAAGTAAAELARLSPHDEVEPGRASA